MISSWSTSTRRSTRIRHRSAAFTLGAPAAYIASFGWVGQGTAAPDLNTVWTAIGGRCRRAIR